MDFNISSFWFTVLIILAIWEVVWKAGAMWRAARHDQPVWFVLLLIINTAGILPIVYLFMSDRHTHVPTHRKHATSS